MVFKTFKGYENQYFENIDGTADWFYSKWPACDDAEEIFGYNGKYQGNVLLIANIDGSIFEPFKKQKNVFLEKPKYSREQNLFGLLRYDFNKEILEIYTYSPQKDEVKSITELPFSLLGDLKNIWIEKEPFMLVKTEICPYKAEFLYPIKKTFEFEEHETLFCIDGDKIITNKWVEDPGYREEIITRRFSDGSVISRERGYIREMPNGEIWKTVE